MKRLRRGMLVADRDQLRQQVLARQLDLAYRRASEYGLSHQCKTALRLQDSSVVRELHESCRSEDRGGTGCLCPCHDVRSTVVISGSAPPLSAR